jgi:complex III assembly factor LYRM7
VRSLSSAASPIMALSAYRHLLRATRIAFQGDFHLLHAARTQARAGFDSLRSLESDSEEAVKGIQHAEGVASVLRHNIVQGKQAEGTDVFSMR